MAEMRTDRAELKLILSILVIDVLFIFICTVEA